MEQRWAPADYILLRKYEQHLSPLTWETRVNSIPNALYKLTKEDAALLSPRAALKLCIQNNTVMMRYMHVEFDVVKHFRVHCLLAAQF
jgi:hypothetical protein